LTGGVFFFVVTATGRAVWVGSEEGSRYVHIVVAMICPALAIAADAVVRRWTIAAPLVLATLLIGIPGNIARIRVEGTERFALGNERLVTSVPRAPWAHDVPRSVRPIPASEAVTMGWLLDGVDSGRVPEPPALREGELGAVSLRFVLRFERGSQAGMTCEQLTSVVDLRLADGRRFAFRGGPVTVQQLVADEPSEAVVFQPSPDTHVRALAGPLQLRIAPTGEALPVELCT
jgi:hypothetical protein